MKLITGWNEVYCKSGIKLQDSIVLKYLKKRGRIGVRAMSDELGINYLKLIRNLNGTYTMSIETLDLMNELNKKN